VDGAESNPSQPQWFTSGDTIYPAMLAAIDEASEFIAFETYTFAEGRIAEQFRGALVEAAERGVRVRVLVDGIGSMELPDYFWHPLQSAGGEVRVFNPVALGHLSIRNHRKLLVCDRRTAFIGGFNIANEYEGDGITRGWCDLGLRLEGTLATQLARSFDLIFPLADMRHKRFIRLRKPRLKRTLAGNGEKLLLSGPGRGASPLHRALRRDLRRVATAGEAAKVRIVSAYFLPTWRIRRDLQRIARRGGRVQLLLAGRSDVALSHLAARSQYQRLLRAGVEIYEYQPQILHAKLFIVGEAVYAGSANLDLRSLHLNYELMARFESAGMKAQADVIFDGLMSRSRRIERRAWRKSRSFWTRWKERWSNFLLARIDPWLSLREWRALPD
jgi:cardiolipin synthase